MPRAFNNVPRKGGENKQKERRNSCYSTFEHGQSEGNNEEKPKEDWSIAKKQCACKPHTKDIWSLNITRRYKKIVEQVHIKVEIAYNTKLEVLADDTLTWSQEWIAHIKQ